MNTLLSRLCRHVIHINPLCQRLLAVGLMLALPVWHAGAVEVFGLTAHHPPSREAEDGAQYSPNLIYRELVRQSVLIVVRDEFGLATRDQTLQEPLPAAESADLFDIEVAHVQAKRVDYVIRRGDEEVYRDTAPFFFGQRNSTWAVLKPLQEQSRGPLVQALIAAGLEHKPLPVNLDGGGVSEQIAQALSKMDVVSQYAAVRMAHRAMREHGETRDLLLVLARGYANLSQMTMFHHSAMRNAFAARGLIYADRLIRLEPESPIGFWARGYAGGLWGTQQQSLWDFSFATDRAKAMDPRPAMPEWAELVEMANHYYYDVLTDRVEFEGSTQELTAFLLYRSAEFSGNNRINIETGRRALQYIPGCMRIYEGINRVAGVRWGHHSTTHCTKVWDQRLPRALEQAVRWSRTLDPLINVLDNADSALGRRVLARQLAQAAGTDRDRHEPSVAVLGELINEQNVVQITYRARFLQDQLSVDARPYLRGMEPALEGHRHRQLIMTLALPKRPTAKRLQEVLDGYSIAPGSVVLTQRLLLDRLSYSTPLGGGRRVQDLANFIGRGRSVAEPEYIFDMLYGNSEKVLQYARWAAGIVPHSPLRITTLIYNDWEGSKQHADAWERRYGHHPAVAYALASQYEKEQDPDRALKLYTRYSRVCPDYNVYYMLAAIHWRVKKDRDKALSFVNDFLLQEDYGLEHANLAKAVAYSYMEEGDYESALPWAQRAARSGAYWAMACQAYCLEHLGEPEKAMEIWAATARRYRASGQVSAALRLNLDAEKAWSIAEQYLRAHHARNFETERLYKWANHQMLYAEPEAALQAMAGLIDKQDDRPFYLIQAAYLAGKLGDREQAADYLQRAAEYELNKAAPNLRAQRSIHREVAAILLKGLQDNNLDTQRLLEHAGQPGDMQYINILGFVALTLEVIDPDNEQVTQLWKKVAGSAFRYRTMTLIAIQKLRARGIEPMDQPVRWQGFRVNSDPELSQ